MPATVATPQIGFKAQLLRGNADGPPETFTQIPGLHKLMTPKMKAGLIDSTQMGQASVFRGDIAGLRDAGEMTIELVYDVTDVTQKLLLSDFNAGTTHNYKLLFPDGSDSWIMSAFIIGFEVVLPLDGLVLATLTFKVQGEPTFQSGVTP